MMDERDRNELHHSILRDFAALPADLQDTFVRRAITLFRLHQGMRLVKQLPQSPHNREDSE